MILFCMLYIVIRSRLCCHEYWHSIWQLANCFILPPAECEFVR